MSAPIRAVPIQPPRRRKATAFRVAIALPHGIPFLERFLVGVADHARNAGWTFVRLPERMASSLDWLRGWDGDGVLAAVETQQDADTALGLGIPVVNIIHQIEDLALPTVTIDHRAVGRLAAVHLYERRFPEAAFYGVAGRAYSRLRLEGFTGGLAGHGIEPRVLLADARTPRAWLAHQRRLTAWIGSLPTPTCILAATDERAMEVLEICRQLGRRVPDEIAVIGVDNDPVLCEFANPPLTSIARDDISAGHTAASLLQGLMEARLRGRTPPRRPAFIPIAPAGIVTRASTSIYPVHHPQVAMLLERILNRLRDPTGMRDLFTGLPLARRRLEDLFHRELGLSPYQFVLRERVRLAREALTATPVPTRIAVARACGFRSARHLRVALARDAAG